MLSIGYLIMTLLPPYCNRVATFLLPWYFIATTLLLLFASLFLHVDGLITTVLRPYYDLLTTLLRPCYDLITTVFLSCFYVFSTLLLPYEYLIATLSLPHHYPIYTSSRPYYHLDSWLILTLLPPHYDLRTNLLTPADHLITTL